jgi:hypothetical protein
VSFLSVILFLPVFLILGGLFMLFPRHARDSRRTLFNLAALLSALVISIIAMRWGYFHADPAAGAIWKQVLATLFAYAFFLASLVVAFGLRQWLFRPSANRG